MINLVVRIDDPRRLAKLHDLVAATIIEKSWNGDTVLLTVFVPAQLGFVRYWIDYHQLGEVVGAGPHPPLDPATAIDGGWIEH